MQGELCLENQFTQKENTSQKEWCFVIFRISIVCYYKLVYYDLSGTLKIFLSPYQLPFPHQFPLELSQMWLP